MKRKTGGNVIRAQGAAFKIGDLYGFQNPSEIDLESIVADRGIRLKRGGLRGCEARLLRVGQSGIIRVRNHDVSAPQTRFALAHELGHWELHATTQAFICTREKLRDYKTDPMESEANAFASELLMPTAMVRAIIAASEPNLKTAKSIAEKFSVSLTAATIRMFLETRHECFLVLSHNGVVEWWMSGSERFGVWLESRQRLRPQSVAFYLNNEPSADPIQEVVPTDAWFLHITNPEGVEVAEESMLLGNTGRVLSLLSLQSID